MGVFMEDNIAIRVRGLGKKYQLGGPQEKYYTLRDAIVNSVKKPFKAFQKGTPVEGFWALKDISFDVKPGEVVGIIGRNGAGKSTLLKILSRITTPTEGTVDLNGRVGSLLEVGTGFHPEMTGRENIFLNGSILGMKKGEIEQKFDEIVKFAEIDKFIDTPVKRYSSGMYVRLAFAVAAHLDPEILVIDEVLAVGDVAFQKKCLGKMETVAKEGRTVLFVSHNMAAVSSLCSRGILLENGSLIDNNSINSVVQKYLEVGSATARISLSLRKDRQGTGEIRFTEVWVSLPNGKKVDYIQSGQNIQINASYEQTSTRSLKNVRVAFSLRDRMNQQISDIASDMAGYTWNDIPTKGIIICTLPKLPLNAGIYNFNVICYVNEIMADWVLNAGELIVEAGDFFGTGKIPGAAWGPLLFSQEWDLKELVK
jgi:lipopolysaccharide transport system ATP-binding protein